MAIEPLGTAMTYQVQPTQAAAPVQRQTETTEGQPVEIDAPVVDDRVISVSKTQEEGESGQQGDQKKENYNQEMMRQAVQEMSKKATNVSAEFGIHEKTNRITIKIVDKKTKEVIKELPPEKMLDMVAKMWETAGLMVDEKR